MNKLVLFIVAVCFATVAYCDLPVHCEYPSVHGEWQFALTKSGQTRDIVYNTCAFDKPLQEPIEKVLRIRMDPPNVATNVETGSTGVWTLIYDQGFEVRLDNFKYFAFFNFTKEGSKVISHCGETFTAWYHDNTIQSTNWGCWKGTKAQRVEPFVYETPLKTVNLDLVFKNDKQYIEKLNKAQTSWTAGEYPAFEGIPLHKFVKQVAKRTNQMRRSAQKRHMQFMKQFQLQTSASDAFTTRIALPDSFDWRNSTNCGAEGACVSPVRNQGGCGSCYSFGATGMFADRVRVQTKGAKSPVFAPQDILSCDPYNQACEGGFSFSVSKYGQDFGIALESCDPYLGRQTQCTNKCAPSTRTFIKDYHYIGGYYGACNEQVMIEALVSSGPYAVDFEVYRDFFNYRGGIYHHVKVDGAEPDPHWEEANHVVEMVGYGVNEKGQKYWIVKNSWGSGWGVNGYFWIQRGTDECAIESAAVEAFPITE